MTATDALRQRAQTLRLYGLIEHWPEVSDAPWLEPFLLREEQEHRRRSLERRLKDAHIGRFKGLDDFDWRWPKRCDRAAVEALMTLDFIKDATNVILIGQNGVGKTMLAKNIAHQALIRGHTVLFTSAGEMLSDLAAIDSDSTLRRRLRRYVAPDVLVIDEIGYLSYSNRYADLLFEVISRRYENKSILVTTNKPFATWAEMFPSAACVISMVDRLVHHAQVIAIEGESYRLKEAKERTEQSARQRRSTKASPR